LHCCTVYVIIPLSMIVAVQLVACYFGCHNPLNFSDEVPSTVHVENLIIHYGRIIRSIRL
jgi:hypothetical protein